MIRVRAMDSGAWIQAEDTSNSTFTIKAAAGTLTVGSPNGGENWQVGTAYNVTWTSTGDTSTWNYQNVALSTDGGADYTNIGTGLAASARSLSFTPTSSQASTSAMIRVRAMDSGAWIQAEDTSNSTFTIKAAAGTLTVGSPNGGENWQVGTAYNVTWTSTGDTSTWNYQNVALSTDGGAELHQHWHRLGGVGPVVELHAHQQPSEYIGDDPGAGDGFRGMDSGGGHQQFHVHDQGGGGYADGRQPERRRELAGGDGVQRDVDFHRGHEYVELPERCPQHRWRR